MELLWKVVESGLSKLIDKGMDFALSKQEKTTFEYLRSDMRSLCFKATTVKVNIREAELSGKKKRKREVDDWLEQVQTIENELCSLEDEIETEGFVRKFFGGDRATKLEARVHELVEQSRHFGELVCNACDIKGEILLTKGLVGEDNKQNLETILRFLLVEKVSIIGIYGMGGVGKTALAKHVNNQLQQQTQERVAWITVSQEFTITRLQDEIAKFVHLDLSDEHDEDKRASKLNRVLFETKNLVFIFDDVWKDLDLKQFGDPLVHGCKLLITTRSRKVCYQLDCEKIIEVKTIKENEAWNLFKETHKQVMNLSGQVQEIAKSMVKICDGLPLGVITIAGTMKGETNFHVWSDVFAELNKSIMGQEDMEDKVFKVLKYSFDRLDRCEGKNNGYSKSQQCFLYCSLYPKDKIERGELIRKFILEEFLDEQKSRKALISQGHAILDKLVNVCLLQGIGDRVKMHDLVRAMALKINEGKTKVIAGSPSLKEIPTREEWAKDIEKMSLTENGITRVQDGVSPNCPKLSTLLLKGNDLEYISDSIFLQMHNLFILDLSRTSVKQLPNSLSNMVKLKALLLTDCHNLEHVPYLGNMKELRELDLSGTRIKKRPKGKKKLFNLKFLSLHQTRLKMLPECVLKKFPNLQCLHLPINICAPIEEIQELKHMEKFSGRVLGACDFNCLIEIWPSLAYTIRVGLGVCFDFSHSIDCNNLELDDNHLEFSEYDFGSMKDKDVTILAQGVQSLLLDTCKGLSNCLVQDLPRLNNPRFTRTLRLQNCQEIKCLSRIEQFPNRGTMTSTSISISMSSPPPHAFFSSLSVLVISSCHHMKRLGLLASQLQNLKDLSIHSCDMIEEIIEMSANIGGRELGEASSVISFPNLEHLYLQKLPRLKSICSVTMICTSLNYIDLQECQGLEKLPIVFGQPNYDSPPRPSIKILLGEEEKQWWEKLELGHPSHHSLLKPFIHWW